MKDDIRIKEFSFNTDLTPENFANRDLIKILDYIKVEKIDSQIGSEIIVHHFSTYENVDISDKATKEYDRVNSASYQNVMNHYDLIFPFNEVSQETIDKFRVDANRLNNMRLQQLECSISNDMKIHCEELLEDLSKKISKDEIYIHTNKSEEIDVKSRRWVEFSNINCLPVGCLVKEYNERYIFEVIETRKGEVECLQLSLGIFIDETDYEGSPIIFDPKGWLVLLKK